MNIEPIAIVGLACRIPGGVYDIDSFWQALTSGAVTNVDVPPDRWSREWYAGPQPRPGKTTTHQGSFLADIASFDANYFQMSDEEAAATDPQHRLLMELAIEALEDAGLTDDDLRGRSVGVFVALSDFGYAVLNLRDVESVSAHSHCSKHYMAANRISAFLDLRGPSITADAACASSLVALHLACQSLASGECEIALCGAANVLVLPQRSVNFSLAGTLAPDGRSKPFEAKADGYGRGEGAGILVLRRKDAALSSHDRIHGLVRATGTCHGGRNPLGTWAPRHTQQAALLEDVMSRAGIGPDALAYVEAHGTGTQVGDREEALALSIAIGAHRAAPLPIGSAKGVFGHSEAAAGMTGVLKAIAMLRHGSIPSAAVAEPRTDLDWHQLGLRLNDRCEPLTSAGGNLIIGVNAFGFGGSYAHAIIEGPPPCSRDVSERAPRAMLLPVSAKSKEALQLRIAHLSELDRLTDTHFEALVRTLSIRRTHHEYRTFAVVDPDEALAKAFVNVRLPDAAFSERTPPLVFVFSGTGGQWWGMGRELLEHEPVFRTALEQFDAQWIDADGWSIVEMMREPEDRNRIGRSTRHSSAAQVAVQSALAVLWRHWGITPDYVVGHSLGELAAAHCGGQLTLRDLVALTKARCDWQDLVDGLGTMAAVGVSAHDAMGLLAEHAPELDVAGINAPSATTLSGPVEGIDRICTLLTARGVFARRLRVTVPFHSRAIRAQHERLKLLCPAIQPSAGTCTFVSAMLGGRCDRPLDASYWLTGFEEPVRFFAAIKHLCETATSAPTFLEIGPHPVLGASIEESLLSMPSVKGARALATLRRHEPERRTMLNALGALFQDGRTPRWQALGVTEGRPLQLPRYPWQHRKHWSESAASRRDRLRTDSHPLLGQLQKEPGSSRLVGQARVLPRMQPWMLDHRIAGDLVFPAAAFIEVMRAGAAAALDADAVDLRHIEIERSLTLDPEHAVLLRTEIDPLARSIVVHASLDDGGSWVLHAGCRYWHTTLRSTDSGRACTEHPLNAQRLDADDYYRRQWTRGYQFGACFRSLSNIDRTTDRASAEIARSSLLAGDQTAINVTLIDAMLQIARVAGPNRYDHSIEVPIAVERVRLIGNLSVDAARLEGVHTNTTFDVLTASAVLRGRSQSVIAELNGARRRALPAAQGLSPDPLHWLAHERVVEIGEQRRDHVPGVLLLSENESLSESIRGELVGAGIAVTCVAGINGLLESLERSQARPDIVVDLRIVDDSAPTTDLMSPACLEAHARKALTLLQLLSTRASETEVIFVAPRSEQTMCGIVFAALTALARVAELELPKLHVRVVESELSDLASSLSREVACDSGEREIVYVGQRRHAIRVRPLASSGASESIESAWALAFDARGALQAVSNARTPLAPDAVRVAVTFASLNFRDQMRLSGLYPSEPGERESSTLGDECTGVITEIGARVPDLAIGDTVIVRQSNSCLATELCAPWQYVFKKPADLSDAAAAAVPIAFGTAWYALRTVANLSEGERVLIHSAAGGVGLAAIQIARLCGAQIICTAGTESKRAFLRSLGIEHVFDSKDLGFVDAVRNATHGQGVDVVLNSLAGASLIQSVGLLRDFGRFIEIGKRDLYADTPLGLYALRRNVSLHVVDLGKLWSQRPSAARANLLEVLAAFSRGDLRALPDRVFALSDVSSAFQYFRTGQHIGKIVIDCRNSSRGDLPQASSGIVHYKELIRSDGTYLVSGGFGGLGIVVLEWLINAGARHIVVIARHAANEDVHRRVQSLCEHGAVIEARLGSVADAKFVAGVVNELRETGHALRGVIHLAGTLKDASIDAVRDDDLREVFTAKVGGAWTLHACTLRASLDLFLMFSSAVAVVGAAGQAVYAMANASLDGLARYRRQLGLPAQSLGWGPFAGTGMASSQVVALREHAGVAAFTASELRALLDHIVPAEEPHLLLRAADWSRALPANVRRRYEDLRPATSASLAEQSLTEKIRNSSPAAATALIEEFLINTSARILALPAERLSASGTLGSWGFDSLASINLVNRISYEFGISLGAFAVKRELTLASIAQEVLRRFSTSPANAVAIAAPAAREVRILPIQRAYLRGMRSSLRELVPDAVVKGFDVLGRFDASALEQTLSLLSQRHEVLRARFHHGDQWRQEIDPDWVPTPRHRTVSSIAAADAAIVSTLLAPWDIAHECPLRCLVLHDNEGASSSVVFSLNHLAFDRVSTWILEREIPLIYRAYLMGQSPSLPPVPTPFSVWAHALSDERDAADVAHAAAAIDAVVRQGPKRLAPKTVHSSVIKEADEHDTDDAEVLRLLVRAAARHTHTDGFMMLHNGRSSRRHDLSLTVGPLALSNFISRDEALASFDWDCSTQRAIAIGDALNDRDDNDANAFYSRTISINYGHSGGVFHDDPALRLWKRERLLSIARQYSFASARRVGAGEEPMIGSTTHFILHNEHGKLVLRAASKDPTFTKDCFRAIARDVSAAFQ